MASDLNIAIVGPHCVTSELHGAAILASEGLNLRAICSHTSADASALQRALGPDTPIANAFEQLLKNPDIGAMVMTGAGDGIYDMATAALRAGKSVLLETNTASSSSQKLESLLEAEKLCDGTIAVSYPLRFHSGHREIAKRVREGEFGTLHCVRLHINATSPTQDQSVMGAIGSQLVDQALWLIDQPSSSISHLTAAIRSAATGHDAEVSASWSYPNGPIVQLFCSNQWDSQPSVPASRIELHCKDAKIELLDTLLAGTSVQANAGERRPGRILIEDEELAFGGDSQFVAQLADFAKSVKTEQTPQCGGDVATENARLLKRIFARAETI